MTGKRRKGRDDGGRPMERTTPPAIGSPIQPFPAVRRQTRRDLREDRQRRRRRFGTVGTVVAVVVVLLVAALVVLGLRKATQKDAPTGRTQTTVLMQVKAADGTAAASVLLAHDTKAKQGAEVLVPSRLIGEVCGFGTQPFGDILRLPEGARVSRSALASLMGVTVDGSWVLDRASFAKLVDRLGGVTVDVDVDVLQPAGGGRSVVLVQRGNDQQLDGTRALAFATYSAAGEDQTAQLARLQQVIDAVVAKLPKKASDTADVVRGLGGGSSASLTPEQLGRLLTGFAGDVRANDATFTVLPVVPIDTGGGVTTYRVDATKARQLVQTQFAGSVPGGASTERNHVFIENGVGRPGLVESACDRLVRSGFAFAGSGNAANFDFKTSKVLVFESTAAAADLGARVASALRLPSRDVVVSTRGQNVADVVVILGGDYKP